MRSKFFLLLAALLLCSSAQAQPATTAPAPAQPAPIQAAPVQPANQTMSPTAPTAAPSYLIRGGTVHTLANGNVLQGADVLISNGKIAGVGIGLTPPQGAEVIEAHGRPVTPGLMAAFSQLGILEIDLEPSANDTAADGHIASAAFDVADAINPNSTLIPVARTGGVTRAVVAPDIGNVSGINHIFLGQGAAIHLGLDSNIVIKPHVGMFVMFEPFSSGAGEFGGGKNLDRPVIWAAFREEIADARDYLARQGQYHAPGGSRDQRSVRIDLDALGPVIRGEEPIVAVVDRASDIRQLIAYTKQQNLKLIIAGGSEAWMVAKELAAAQVPVMVDSYTNLPGSFSDLGATLANAARLDAAGVKLMFASPAQEPSHNARRISQIAGNAVANGMNYEHALAAITRNPAEIFGIAGEYGTIEIGKDADVVVWDGDPLEVTSAPTSVFVKGEKIPMESRQTKLRDRYRDLNRKDMPFGYR